MAKFSRLAGATSQSINIFIQNSSVTTGAGLTGFAPAGGSLLSGMIFYYSFTGTNAASVVQSLSVPATVGAAFSAGSIVEIDATHQPGLARLDIPNAMIAASKGNTVTGFISGGTNVAPCVFEIELTAVDNQSTAFGLSLAKTTNITGFNDIAASAIVSSGAITTSSGAVSTVTTVTNQLTAAAIATGVWQDTTSGDFTVSSSIGKSLYTSGVVPGGSGGLFISGSNSGTTTFGALTVTGATTHTGNVLMSAGLTVNQSTTNGSAISITGNGTGHGILSTSGAGATGDGIKAVSGATSGNGITLTHAGSGSDFNATTTPLTLAKTTNITGFNDIAATAVVSSGAITTSGGAVSTVTTTTNLTNAPTAGDFTSTMKTSLNAATPASVTGAVGSVTGNVGGNVVGSVANVTGAVGSVTAQVTANTTSWGGTSVGTIPPDTIFIRSGTAQGGGSTTITLDAGASATNNLYDNCVIFIRSGTGSGQSNIIASYVGSTKVATVSNAWATNPDNTSVFTIAAFGPVIASVSGTVTANVTQWLGSAVTAATSGIPDVNIKNINTQTASAAAGVTFPSSIASPTNITAGTITTATNLTNAATVGDFTATMKTSIGTAVAASSVASVTGAVGSVTGNVGGNVTGSVGSISGVTFPTNFGAALITSAGAITVDGTSPLTEAYASLNGSLTLSKAMYGINQMLGQQAITGTTMTVLKRDQSTTAKTFTLNSAMAPTSITEAT